MSDNYYLNREIGVMRFNERVLELAQDERTPLLEKVNFINIFHSNLDDFFMKRVGGLKAQVHAGFEPLSLDGLSASQQLSLIYQKNSELNKVVHEFVEKDLKKELEKNNISLLRWRNLSAKEKSWVTDFFKNKVFPVLTPMAVDQGHPFPLISNLSTSIAVSLKHPDEEALLFARIKIPPVFPMWVQIESQDAKAFRFISLIDIVIQHLEMLFPEMVIENMMTFRVTRNIDIKSNKDDDDADDLLEQISEELKQRRFHEIVRLEHGNNPDPWLLQFLLEELDLKMENVIPYPGRLEYKDLKSIYKITAPQLKYSSIPPAVPHSLMDDSISIFHQIKQNDILAMHPYEVFSGSVERFIQSAATDPQVVAIKMIFYRTMADSQIVKSLIQAAELGKQVVCLIEIKARMDEERNIHLAQILEDAGVHVVYGIVGLKTHAKVTLVVRQEQDEFKTYAHIGTGNYNPITAKLYTDMSLFTVNPEITRDLTELFHFLTGRSLKNNYQKILVAPVNMKTHFLNLIQLEIQNKKLNKPAQIIAKMNSLEDRDIIQALYRASQAGVSIQLIVRGFCCLQPGIKGVSDNIKVISILGRFLEHSRIFYFRNGEENPSQGLFFMGSADWMSRNLLNRVEVISPILDKQHKSRLYDYLDLCLQDTVFAWDLNSSGEYKMRGKKSNFLESSQDLQLKQIYLKQQLYLQKRILQNSF